MSRRTLQPAAVLVASLAVLALITLLVSVPPQDQNDPSSRSAGRLGTLAMYTWLQRLGLPVARLSGSFDLSQTDVLVEYDPSTSFSSADVDSIAAHLRGGGDIILAFGPESITVVSPLLQRLGVVPAGLEQAGSATPAQPFDAADRVHDVPTALGYSLLPAPPLVPLLVQGGAVVAGGVSVNGGRAYVLADTQPLSNDGLRHADSATLVLSLLERARGGRVVFDEYHHGEGQAGSGGVSTIFAGPVGVAAALAALLVLVALALNGRRLGQPALATEQQPVSTAAYITAMGDLFARSRKRGAVAARYADDLKRHVSARSGTDPHLDDSTFVESLRAAGQDSWRDVERLLARARMLQHGDPDEAALLQLARDVDMLERTMSHEPALSAQWRR